MVDYREILRLRSLGDSIRSIARSVCSGRDTVSEVLKAAEAAGIAWPLEDDVTNEDIQAILFPVFSEDQDVVGIPDVFDVIVLGDFFINIVENCVRQERGDRTTLFQGCVFLNGLSVLDDGVIMIVIFDCIGHLK